MLKRVLLIDLMNMFVRNFSAIRLTNENGEHVGGFFGTLQSIQGLVNRFDPEAVVVVWEGKGSSERRRKTLKTYKEGRSFKGLNRHFDTVKEEETESFARQLRLLKETLDMLPVYQLGVKYLEADDVIAYLTTQVLKRDDIQNIIVSTDRDYLQLVDESTIVFRPVKKGGQYGETIGLNDVGVYPPNYLLVKSIIGDNSDKIAGIKGVGEKTVLKDFPILQDQQRYRMKDLIGYCKVSGKKYQKYVDAEEKLLENEKLMQLLEPDVTLDDIREMENTFKNKKTRFTPPSFRLKLLVEDVSPTNIQRWIETFLTLTDKSLGE